MQLRPSSRRPAISRFRFWWQRLWFSLLSVFLLAVVLFLLGHFLPWAADVPSPSIEEITAKVENVKDAENVSHESVNITEELLGTTSYARQLVDQMTLAKAYIVIAKDYSNAELAWELSSLIRSCQRLLSQAAVRGKPISQEEAHPIVNGLAKLIYVARDSHYDISTKIVTLKSHAQALEERAVASTVQSAEFAQMASEAVPKYLHCLNTKLTVDWFEKPIFEGLAQEKSLSDNLFDNGRYHFCIFSENVLATSVVINSTITNTAYPEKFVFHVVTDTVHYYAMQTWFLGNYFQKYTVDVENIEEFSWLNDSYSPLVLHYGDTKFQDPESTTLLKYLRFYIPEVYPSLNKIVFLEDDVVVQKDLTPLFSLNLNGHVIGAVETCLESYHRFDKYLNFSDPRINSKFDPLACGWAFGVNVVDLAAWKEANVTARYHYWQKENADQKLWKSGTLPASLLTFYGLVEPLDKRWHVLGLGYDMDIDDKLIGSAAVVHFNGNLKPWLKLAISRYKNLWQHYINPMHPHHQECFM